MQPTPFGLEPFCHSDERDGNASSIVGKVLNRTVATGAVERLARKRCHQLSASKAFAAGSHLRNRQDQTSHAFPGMIGMGIHGSDTSRIVRRIQKSRIPTRCLIAAVERRPATPPPTSGEHSTVLNDVVRLILDQLRVDSHQVGTCTHLGLGQERFLERGNGCIGKGRQRLQVTQTCNTMRECRHIQKDQPPVELASRPGPTVRSNKAWIRCSLSAQLVGSR